LKGSKSRQVPVGFGSVVRWLRTVPGIDGELRSLPCLFANFNKHKIRRASCHQS
jgi:hypothetical protein